MRQLLPQSHEIEHLLKAKLSTILSASLMKLMTLHRRSSRRPPRLHLPQPHEVEIEHSLTAKLSARLPTSVIKLMTLDRLRSSAAPPWNEGSK